MLTDQALSQEPSSTCVGLPGLDPKLPQPVTSMVLGRHLVVTSIFPSINWEGTVSPLLAQNAFFSPWKDMLCDPERSKPLLWVCFSA